MSLMIRATSLRLIPTHGYLMRCPELFNCHIYCLVMSSSESGGRVHLLACLSACIFMPYNYFQEP